MTDLTGRTALVTGASRGIGRATALALGRAGARVIVHFGQGAKEADEVVAAIDDLGGRAEKVQADLRVPDGPHRLARETRRLIDDRLDILVANAGISKAASIEDTRVEDFDDLYAINVRAPFFVVQQLLPAMDANGSIVLVSSLAARASVGTLAAYAATKGAVETLVRHFASALGTRGIRVNGVAPGIIDTELSSFTKTDTGRNAALGLQALKRMGMPDDVGDVVAFLASDASRWISGDIVHVDGGSKL